MNWTENNAVNTHLHKLRFSLITSSQQHLWWPWNTECHCSWFPIRLASPSSFRRDNCTVVKRAFTFENSVVNSSVKNILITWFFFFFSRNASWVLLIGKSHKPLWLYGRTAKKQKHWADHSVLCYLNSRSNVPCVNKNAFWFRWLSNKKGRHFSRTHFLLVIDPEKLVPKKIQ